MGMAFHPRIANIWGSSLLSSCATSVFVISLRRVDIRYWIARGGCCFMWLLGLGLLGLPILGGLMGLFPSKTIQRYGVITVTCAYSGHFNRYYLTYHTPHQILWGFAIGVLLGLSLYILTELIPRRYPTSLLGRAKNGLLRGQVMTWLQIRDGWGVWTLE